MERSDGIHLGIQSRTHLHLVDGKQVGIFTNRLLVHYSIGVVLVEIIFELTARNRLATYGHHHRI